MSRRMVSTAYFFFFIRSLIPRHTYLLKMYKIGPVIRITGIIHHQGIFGSERI